MIGCKRRTPLRRILADAHFRAQYQAWETLAEATGDHCVSATSTGSSSGEVYPLRCERNVRIPMPDGVTLAADLFRPDAPGQFPVVIEYLPYRKNDYGHDGYFGHRYMAERGYVVARIDVRGTGDSEGVAEDEYCRQEQLDGVAAIA